MDKLARLKVLYVEDDEFIREELSETLEFDVKELYVAKDGLEGLEKFKKFSPDIVISDVKMPKMNGLEMSKKIKQISASTPIIITTAFSDSNYLMEAIKIGVNRYVTKPVDIDKLYEALNELATIVLHKKEKVLQEKYLHYILDFNPGFILLADKKKSKIEYMNKTFLNFLGFDSFVEFDQKIDEIDLLVEEIKDMDDNSYPTKNWLNRIIDNKATQYIVYFRHKSDKPFVVLGNSFDDLDKKILLFSDITTFEFRRINLMDEIKKLEIDNQEKMKLLKIQAKQAAMGEMLSAIVHQWKQPINVLSLSMQLLQDDYENEQKFKDDDVNECIQESLKQIEYMTKTITDFRNFFSENKQIKSFSLKKSLNNVLSLFSKQLVLHNVSVEIDMNEDINLLGYMNEFEQILINIIKNAKDIFDTMDNSKDKKIKCSYKQKNNFVEVEIEDNAGGIKPEHINRIFDNRFTTKESGEGVGLYISRMLAQNMNGDITVKSSNGKTKFIVILPKG